jgi:phosphatidylglycerol:prolipoprotein diacylglycerol transferase
MLPVLFEIPIAAAWAKPALVAIVLAVTLGRAGVVVLGARRSGRPVGLLSALRDDGWVVAGVVLVAGGLWGSGVLARDLRIPVNTYGVLLASAFLVGIWLAQREARRQGQDPQRVADLSFVILVAAWLGSDVYFKLVNWSEFFGPDTFLVRSPVARAVDGLTLGLFHVERVPRFLLPAGLVFYGGFIGAVVASAWYVRRHRMPFLAYADTMLPSLAFGHFLGRLGCFGAGCCWGKVGEGAHPWLVRFPGRSLAYQSLAARPGAEAYVDVHAYTTLPLHPVQLYEAFGELAIFLALVLWVRPRKRFHGQVLAAWLVLYAILRTAVELFRGDVERGVVGGLGVGQWTSIAILVAGAIVWVRARQVRDRAAAAVSRA